MENRGVKVEEEVQMRRYLDSLGSLQRLLRRNPHLPVSEQLLDEEGDVPPRDGDMLYTAANHVALSLEQTATPANQ